MKAVIHAIKYHLPKAVLTNERLAAQFGDWSAEKIEQKTGIRERRIAAEGECASDLALRAAESLLATSDCSRKDVDFLILCTQSPDYFLPTTACVLQERLGLESSCGAFDINLGCSGFVYGLGVAKGLIETGQAKNVMLITADTYSKFLHPLDRSVRTIFGDGAAATLIQGIEGQVEHIGPFVFGTDGRGAQNLIVPTGGSREAKIPAADVYADTSGNQRTRNDLYMNGAEIFTFSLNVVPRTVRKLLSKAGMGIEEVDLYVFHQANKYMLESLRKTLKIEEQRCYISMADVGNTVSSTIPIALERAVHEQRLKSGSRIMLVGFGVGYSWGAVLVRWR